MIVRLLILFVLVFVIVFIDYPVLKRNKQPKEMTLFVMFLVLGVCLNLINIGQIKVPHIMDWLIIVYRPLSQIVNNWLN